MSLGVISISVYRRYTPPAWAMRPVGAYPRQAKPEGPREEPRREPPRREPPPSKAAPRAPARPARSGGSAPRGLLPAGLDSGDLFLAAMLLFLYSESHDEDFLIILIVVGLSIFQNK